MTKSRENAKKLNFQAYFRHFRPEKISFENQVRHILGIAILHQCAKFHEKILSTARVIKKIPFFRQKSAVPAIFRKFRLQKSVLLTNEPCLMVGIVINDVFV